MPRDGHIRLLPLHVANKIAAGEVVERPASVLKELMENALDAEATRIDVTVTAGGRNLVAVRDNGCGMSRDDALLSLERQATSKIRDVDDIENISTLGFRGEAIPSIASVSRFTLTTRRAADDAGTRLVVNAGTLAEVADCGAPPGTCVEVRDLFCNVPARRKFLRAFATEENHIRTTFTVHALAHPPVGFSLTLDGRETYRFAPGATLDERVRDIFGATFADALLPVSRPAPSPGGVSVRGYIARPDRDASLRRDQYVFVNGRPATAPAIAYALREAYPRTRDDARPALVLFIDLPPSQVDVNVHPAKREVRFRRPADVREAVIAAVTSALGGRDGGDEVKGEVGEGGMVKGERVEQTPSATPLSQTLSPSSPFVAPFSTSPSNPSPFTIPPSPPTPSPFTFHPSPPTPLWRWFNVLCETATGFLLLETDAGIVTLNPKAARVRVAFEKIVDRQAAAVASQPLLLPETVELPPPDSARIRSFRAELEAVGFALDEFGRDVWKVDAVPAIVGGESAAGLLASVAADIAEGGAKRGGEKWRDELIAKSVAKSYAGANVKLTREGAAKLVEEVAAARMPYVDPLGKPVMIFTSNRELARKFDL